VRIVSIDELHQGTNEIVSRVEMGEQVAVTRDGIRIAILEPAPSMAWDALVASGVVKRARGPLPTFSDDFGASSDFAGRDAVLDDRYGEGS